MPIHEYRCRQCGTVSDVVVGLQETAVAEEKSAARNHLALLMAYPAGIERKRD
jgi:predicted nucleic acid-binding Zn ribbon protein